MKKFIDVVSAIILVLIALCLVQYLWKTASAREQQAMSVHYCFQEQADGSLYHYVCEK